MKEYEYIQIRKDLFDKYGCNKAIVIQHLIALNDSFVGTLHDLTDRIKFLPYDAVQHSILEMMKCGAIEQVKVAPQVYKITIKDLTKLSKRYSRKEEKKIPKNEKLRELVEKIEQDRANKANKVLENQ